MQIEIIIEVGTPYVYFHSKGFGQKSANNAQIKKISAKKNQTPEFKNTTSTNINGTLKKFPIIDRISWFM